MIGRPALLRVDGGLPPRKTICRLLKLAAQHVLRINSRSRQGIKTPWLQLKCRNYALFRENIHSVMADASHNPHANTLRGMLIPHAETSTAYISNN